MYFGSAKIPKYGVESWETVKGELVAKNGFVFLVNWSVTDMRWQMLSDFRIIMFL